MQGLTQQSDETVGSKQTGSAAFNRQIGLLPLRLDTQMGPALFKGDFNRPALDEIEEDRETRLRLIGREGGADGPFARWIAADHPADRQGRLTCSIPQGGPTAPLHDLSGAIVPLHCQALPGGLRISEDLAQFGQARPFDARSAILTGVTLRCWSAQAGILAQGSDQCDVIPRTGESQREITIGSISDELDGNRWEPAADNCHHWPGQFWHRLVAVTQPRTDIRRSRSYTQEKQRPSACASRGRHHQRHAHPPSSHTDLLMLLGRARTIVGIAAFAHVDTLAPFERFID
jgi:hypothetical protein